MIRASVLQLSHFAAGDDGRMIYANPWGDNFDHDEGPGLLLSPVFWIGMGLSFVFWLNVFG